MSKQLLQKADQTQAATFFYIKRIFLLVFSFLALVRSTTAQTVVYTQSFEAGSLVGSWIAPGQITDAVGAWTGTTTPANNVWHRNNTTTGWNFATSGAYTPGGANGTTYSARFHTYGASSGAVGQLITPNINLTGYTNMKVVRFYYINTDGTDVLNVYASTNGGGAYTLIGTLGTSGAWTRYDLPIGMTSTNQLKIRIEATSDNLFTDIGVDELQVIDDPTWPIATLPYSQNFDGTWTSRYSTRDVPDQYWLGVPATGNASWRRQDDGASAGWGSSGSGLVTPSSGSAADFHSYNASSGSTGSLLLFVNFSPSGTKQLAFDVRNNSRTNPEQLQVSYSTDGGLNYTVVTTISTAQTAWTTYRFDLTTSTSSQCVIKFTGTSDFGTTDIGLENVYVCVKPTATASASPATVCDGTTTLTATVASGAAVMWSVAAGSGTIASPASDVSGVSGVGLGSNTYSMAVSKDGCTASASAIVTNNGARVYADKNAFCSTPASTTARATVNSAAHVVRWERSTNGTTWTNIGNAGVVALAVSTANSLLAVGTNYFRVFINNGSCPGVYSNTTIITITSAAFVWEGDSDNDWFNGNNWCGGTAPTSSDDVLIPPGTPYNCLAEKPLFLGFPTGTIPACHNIEIMSGAVFSTYYDNGLGLPSSTEDIFRVYGNIINNGTWTHSASAITTIAGILSGVGGWVHTIHNTGVTNSSSTISISGTGVFDNVYVRVSSTTGGQTKTDNLSNNITLTGLWIETSGKFYLNNNTFTLEDLWNQEGIYGYGTSAQSGTGTGTTHYLGGSTRIDLTNANFIEEQGLTWFKSTTQSQDIPGGMTYYDLKANNNSATVVSMSTIFAGTGAINCRDFILVQGNGAAGQADLYNTLTASRHVEIGTGTQLEENGNIINLSGNWTNNGSFIAGGGTTNFLGTTDQRIGGSVITTYATLTQNNTAAGSITLDQDVRVSNQLNLTSGAFNINKRLLTITTGATNGISRTNGYLVSEDKTDIGTGHTNNGSKVQWNIGNTGGAHVFPFGLGTGLSPTNYIPFTVNNSTSGNAGDVTLSTFHAVMSAAPQLYPLPPTATHLRNFLQLDNSSYLVKRFWTITRSGGTAALDVTFSYVDGGANDEKPDNTSGVNGAETNLRAQRYNGTTNKWEYGFIPGQVNTPAANTVYVPGITNFSDWAITKAESPLPVELLSFEAKSEGKRVKLSWSVASERNVDKYIIGRSQTSTSNFTSIIAEQKAQSNIQGTNVNHYVAYDEQPSKGMNYYQLKEQMLDNEVKPLSIAAINIGLLGTVSLAPNPAKDNVKLSFLEEIKEATLIVYNTKGDIVMTKKLDGAMSGNSHDINISGLTAGAYLFSVSSEDGMNEFFRLIKY